MFTTIHRRDPSFGNLGLRVEWCADSFGPGREVHSITQAELHRWSYERIGFGLVAFHFLDENDYMFYLLRWG